MKKFEVTFEVLRRAKEGDEKSLNKIFNIYSDFIYIKARKFFIKGSEKKDVMQEAMIGLLKAIKGYNKDLASFNTFASLCIQRQITTAIKVANSSKNLSFNKVTKIEDSNIIHKDLFYDVEEKFTNRDEIDFLYSILKRHLSEFEQKVLNYLVIGYNYIEIATLLEKDIKIIDNSIQRIKKKSIFWFNRRK